MIFGILLILFLWVVYTLLVKGVLWKLILAIFGWFGLFIFLGMNYPSTAERGAVVSDTLIPWNVIIPTVIVLLALAYTKEE